MPETDTRHLPVVPLDDGVVLPHMVVTLALETDEAKAAVDAATAGEKLVLLVARTAGRYARIGTVAKLEELGRLPDGNSVCVVRGLHRAVIGGGVAGAGSALWVQAQDAPDPEESSERTRELARVYRALIENII